MDKRMNISSLLLQLLTLTILANGCTIRPPAESGAFNTPELVEIIRLDSSIHLDIRYATRNNFTGKKMYGIAGAFLQKPAAEALVNVSRELRPLGYGLLVFDGYRPWSVTKKFWKITPKNKRHFVADPRKGSRHNRGCAVDLTLYELSTGRMVEMTGEYDEMTKRSYPDYQGGSSMQRQNRDLLRSRMEANGFTVYPYEWWHFDFKGWEKFQILNLPFEEIN
jgi:D-alanyl-D-alanine dipeptidase